MALLQISEPGEVAGAARAAARGRHRPRHHQLAGRHGAQRHRRWCCPTSDGRPLLPSIVRYCATDGVEVGYARAGAQARRSAEHDRLGEALHGPRRWPTSRRDGAFPYRFVDAPGMVQIETARRRARAPVEVSAEILRALRERAEATPRRRARRRGGHGAGVLRRRAAPGDQGRGAARRPERAAPAQRADRGGDRLRPRQRVRRHLRRLRPRRRHVRHLDPASSSRGVFEVLATDGDSALGGDDFDHACICWVIEHGQAAAARRRATRACCC